MKSLFTLLVILTFSTATFSQEDKTDNTTTYYLIRHAEKDQSDKANRNPNLTEVGKTRAERWSSIFQNVSFDAVYSTNYNRTKQTAQPTANKNELELSFYDPRALYSEEFAKVTKGKTVLVVGHSNTTPAFVNMILGEKKHKDIDHNNNGNLYIVTIAEGKATDQVLTIN